MTRRRPPPRMPPRPVAEPLEGRAYFAPLAFAPVVSYPAGVDPADVVAADVNGDGHPDLIVADYGSPQVAVLMNNGNGTFATPVFYSVPTPPDSIAVADLNGDGHPDIAAVGPGGDFVSVLTNAGDGTFGPAAVYAVGTGPEAVVAADVTGDGHPDLVTANQGSNTVSVLANNGDGTFAAAADYPAGAGPDALAAADLNGDGLVDLVTLTPDDNVVRVLLNQGGGTFPLVPASYAAATTGRAIAIADTNNDGRPDLIVADLRSANVTVLPNQGQGLFDDGTTTVATGNYPFAVAAADLNGDNRPDLITVDNRDDAVGVLPQAGLGGFTRGHRSFPVGAAPEAVAVADVDGDGRPDLITADFNDGAVGVLLNRTAFPPLTPTAVTVAASQNPVQVGNPLTLTATVAPAPSPAFRAGRVVQFLAGDQVLGLGRLSAGGVATITTAKLPVGTTSVVARFNGNGGYAASAATLDEVVQAAADAAPLVAATAVVRTGRAGSAAAPFVPGDTGSAAVTITDAGAGRATGSVSVALSIAPDGDPAAAVPLASVGTATFAINLRGGTSRTVPVRFRLPVDGIDGNYLVLASLVPAATLTAGQVSATPAVTATPVTVALAFGTVALHQNYGLTFTLGNGASVTLAIRGGGSAVVTDTPAEFAAGQLDVAAVATSPGTTISITPRGGGPVALASLVDNRPLGGLIAPAVVLRRARERVRRRARAQRRGQDGHARRHRRPDQPGDRGVDRLGPGRAADAVAGRRRQHVGGRGPADPVLAVTSWTADPRDGVTAPGVVGPLDSLGDFGARLLLSGIGLGTGLSTVAVGGTLDSPTWVVNGNVGYVTAGAVGPTFVGSIAGTLARLTVAGAYAGTLAARQIGTVEVGGDLAGGTILAGATFGPDGLPGGGDDTFNAGRISLLQVGGNVTGAAFVAAGFRPTSDSPYTGSVGGTLIPAGGSRPSRSAAPWSAAASPPPRCRRRSGRGEADVEPHPFSGGPDGRASSPRPQPGPPGRG